MNNPPAFPRPLSGVAGDYVDPQEAQEGMTLRDYFAGMALQGIIRHPDAIGEDEETIAAWCYKAADSMLREREKQP